MNDLNKGLIEDLVIDSQKYNFVSNKLRSFFLSKGYIECYTQNRLSILAACEDVQNIISYNILGQKWPMIQTNQMWLEYELLKHPNYKGVFVFTTSYREEKNPIRGRHLPQFPMIEFESHGEMDELIALESELVQYLGYQQPVELDYTEMCNELGVDEISHKEETKLGKEYGNAILLKNFKESSNPFWNMKRNHDNNTAYKIDVLLSGAETIGSAVRSCDINDMRNRFYTITDGKYAETLFNTFGKERVEKELEEFLNLPMKPRFGGGCGLSRLISSMESEGLLPNFD